MMVCVRACWGETIYSSVVSLSFVDTDDSRNITRVHGSKMTLTEASKGASREVQVVSSSFLVQTWGGGGDAKASLGHGGAKTVMSPTYFKPSNLTGSEPAPNTHTGRHQSCAWNQRVRVLSSKRIRQRFVFSNSPCRRRTPRPKSGSS